MGAFLTNCTIWEKIIERFGLRRSELTGSTERRNSGFQQRFPLWNRTLHGKNNMPDFDFPLTSSEVYVYGSLLGLVSSGGTSALDVGTAYDSGTMTNAQKR
jgi:hypothetical protein